MRLYPYSSKDKISTHLIQNVVPPLNGYQCPTSGFGSGETQTLDTITSSRVYKDKVYTRQPRS